MTRKEIEQKVFSVISNALNVPIHNLTQETTAGELQVWDSVMTVIILTEIQQTFGLTIPDEDLFEMVSIRAIVDEIIKLDGGCNA